MCSGLNVLQKAIEKYNYENDSKYNIIYFNDTMLNPSGNSHFAFY